MWKWGFAVTIGQITRVYTHLCAGWQTLWQREEGANLVLIALVIPVLLSFAGLVIDGSNAYRQNQRVQITADAAALGGARLLALGNSTAQAQTEAQRLVALNMNDATSVISFVNANTQIQVTTTHSFPTYFAGIMGFYTMTVSASASARSTTVTSAGNLMPLTVLCTDVATFEYGKTYILTDGDKIAPGNIGWLRWNESDSTSAEKLASNIDHPENSRVLKIGDPMYATPGNKQSNLVKTALDKWINKTVTLPLYDTKTGTGSNVVYTVCGFAQFVLSDYNKSTVTGKFVRGVISDGGIGSSAPDFGARDVRITQ